MEKNRNTSKVRLAEDVIERLEELSAMTRRPMSKIATEAMRYALEHVRMVQVDCYDVVFGGDGDND